MPPLILWGLGAVGAVAAGRWLYREWQRINEELHPEPPVDELPTRKLERDPATGEYRPK